MAENDKPDKAEPLTIEIVPSPARPDPTVIAPLVGVITEEVFAAALIPPSRRSSSQGLSLVAVRPEEAVIPDDKRVSMGTPQMYFRIECRRASGGCGHIRPATEEESAYSVFCTRCGHRVDRVLVDPAAEPRAQTLEFFPRKSSVESQSSVMVDGMEEFLDLFAEKDDENLESEDPTIPMPALQDIETVNLAAPELEVAAEAPVELVAQVTEPSAVRHELPEGVAEELPSRTDVTMLRGPTEKIVLVGVPMPEEIPAAKPPVAGESPVAAAEESLVLVWSDPPGATAPSVVAEVEPIVDLGEDLVTEELESTAPGLAPESIEPFKKLLLGALAEGKPVPPVESTVVAEPEPELPEEAVVEPEKPVDLRLGQGYRLVPYLAVVITLAVALGVATYYLAIYFK